MKIVIDNKIPFINGVFEPFADVVYKNGSEICKADVINAQALIVRTRTQCNKALLEGTDIRFIATATIGFDHIDTQWCNENNIYWTNAAGCNAGSVMQYVASVLVYLYRKHKFNFHNRTLGVVGVGNVGKKIVKLAEIFGMRVVLCDPPLARRLGPCGFISLEGLLREADIITLHVPLNTGDIDNTHHLFNASIFKKMNNGSFLINSSRGEVVNTNDIKYALRNNTLADAAIDVWENEPTIDNELLNMVSIATPHIAGYSADGKANGTTKCVHALGKFFNIPLNNWQVLGIPLPTNNNISINCLNNTDNEIICKAIEATYNLTTDNLTLRENSNNFEKYRENYPLRREFNAFRLSLINCNHQLSENLKRLGFQLV